MIKKQKYYQIYIKIYTNLNIASSNARNANK